MRRLRRVNAISTALVASLAVLTGAGGVAAALTVPRGARTVDAHVLAATGVGGTDGASLAPPVTSSTSTTAPPAPATTSTTARNVGTTTTTNGSRVGGTAGASKPAQATVPATTAVGPTTTTSVPASPSSWAVDQSGISVRVRIDPAVPTAGQAVRFIIDTSTTTGAFCCLNILTVNGVQEPLPKGGPAIDANGATITSTHEEQTWTVPDGAWLNFLLSATSIGGPPVSPTQPAPPIEVKLVGSTKIAP